MPKPHLFLTIYDLQDLILKMMSKLRIFFDLEGPLSPQDHGYESMGLIPHGKHIFSKLSRYDDLLFLEGKPGYQPGSTLALIAPFLIRYGITSEDLVRISLRSSLVPGSKELISVLRDHGWEIYIVSTSYHQHAFNIGAQLGIPASNIFCTHFSPQELELTHEAAQLIDRVSNQILNLELDRLRPILDLFFEQLSQLWGDPLELVHVMGGSSKLQAIKSIQPDLSQVVVVGDSITDQQMLHQVSRAGGISIGFNANEYALPYANLGLASTNLSPLYILLEAIESGQDVFQRASTWESLSSDLFHITNLRDISKSKLQHVLQIHRRYRELVRKEAAGLG